MKNQYFGDINDYRKYGLLRSIMSVSNLNTLIAWMLTENDGSSDGKFIKYLSNPEKWEKYDKNLYLGIGNILQKNEKREVSLIENSGILNESRFYSKLVPDEESSRKLWFSELIEKSKNTELVFLDPDNGIEIKSKKKGTKNSSKYVYWNEVSALWSSGKSLLIYQHFIREKRSLFIERMLKLLSEKTEGSIVEAFSTPNVVFLLALQPEHHCYHESIVHSVQKTWVNQIQCLK
ncbi:MAG: hypothetical protein ABGX51_03660 [Gammaproteobacteria bacterium]